MRNHSVTRKLATVTAALFLFAALAQLPGGVSHWWNFYLFLGCALVWGALAVINPKPRTRREQGD